MYEIASKMDSSKRLVEVLHLINYLLRNSPSNFHAKLLCLQIFHMLGCTYGAHEIYQSLDIKHIQLDSLGYLHCAHLPMTGIFSLAKPIYDQTLKFFTASYKDSLEYLAMCYRYGSFSKLIEFMDFREKLSNSIHYSTISVEALLQEIICFNGSSQQYNTYIQGMKIEPNEDRIKYEELTDDRDLDVMIRWDPTFKFTSENLDKYDDLQAKYKEKEKESFNDDVELLQIRSTLLRIVAFSLELIHDTTSTINGKTETQEIGANFKILLQKWRELFMLAKKLHRQPEKCDFLVNLLPSRLYNVLQLPYEDVFSSLADFVYDLTIENENAKNNFNKLIESFQTIKNLLKDLKPIEDDAPIFYYRNLQANIVGCIEVS
jgi:N-terminal acetyltransferase B complex non-catalytic subunit